MAPEVLRFSTHDEQGTMMQIQLAPFAIVLVFEHKTSAIAKI